MILKGSRMIMCWSQVSIPPAPLRCRRCNPICRISRLPLRVPRMIQISIFIMTLMAMALPILSGSASPIPDSSKSLVTARLASPCSIRIVIRLHQPTRLIISTMHYKLAAWQIPFSISLPRSPSSGVIIILSRIIIITSRLTCRAPLPICCALTNCRGNLTPSAIQGRKLILTTSFPCSRI